MSCLCQRAPRAPLLARAFTTSARQLVSLGLGANDRQDVADVIPAYPYGPTQWYKQSAQGLYGGQKIQFGNNTSEEYRQRTRRTWLPNVKSKRLFSKALARHVQIRVTLRTLRTIEKVGGLDEYLLGEKEARIKELGEAGWWLRWAVMQTKTVKDRFAKQRKELGLSSEDFDKLRGQDTQAAIMSLPSEEDPSTDLLSLSEGEEALLDELNPPEGEESSTDIQNLSEGEEPSLDILSLPEDKRNRLKFRVSRDTYVQLKDDKWVTVSTRARQIERALQRYSPTHVLREWDAMEDIRTAAGKEPYSEVVRLAWLNEHRRIHEALLKEYAVVKRSEPAHETTTRQMFAERLATGSGPMSSQLREVLADFKAATRAQRKRPTTRAQQESQTTSEIDETVL